MGNRLAEGGPGGNIYYAYDNANRLITIDGTYTYTWDDNGNLIANGQGVTFTYNGTGDRLGDLIDQREITQDEIEEIGRVAAAIKRRLPGCPTHAQQRDLLDVLSVDVKLRRDESGRRWLDLRCGMPDWDIQAEIHSSAKRTG